MIRRVSSVFAIVEVLLIASGCRSSSPADFTMQRSKSCTVSSCAARTQKCSDWTRNCYSDCDQIDDADLGIQCYDVCASHDCSCTPEQVNGCDQWGFTFTLPPSRDERLYQACLEAAVRDATCQEHTLDANCDTVGRVEDPRLTAVYACIANAPCGSGVQGCLSGVPTGTLGDEYCAVRASCGSFDPEVEAELSCKGGEAARIDALSGRMRREALAAARTCFSEVCSDVIPCMDGWLAAVTGSSVGDSPSPTSGMGGAGGGPAAGGAAGGPGTGGAGGKPTFGAGGAAMDVAGAPGIGGAGGQSTGGAGGSSTHGTGGAAGAPGLAGAGGGR